MLGLDYGSDDDSDVEAGEKVTPTAPPPAPKSAPAPAEPKAALSGGLQLPAPTNKSSRRKDGPVKIKIDALATSEDQSSDEPPAKKTRTDTSSSSTRGAGSSSLVSMLSKLPAPKAAPAPAKPVRVLGGGHSNASDDPGVVMPSSSAFDDSFSGFSETSGEGETTSSISFTPAALSKAKAKPANSNPKPSLPAGAIPVPSMSAPPVKKPSAPAVDFFSLGGTSSAPTVSTASSSGPSVSISSAPSVTEYEPPPPSIDDPYPGYYQKPSGDWAAYNPEYYKSFWESWNTEAVQSATLQPKGKRKDRTWDGVESEDLQEANAREEMLMSQMAEREATKGITTAPAGPAAQPKMNIKASVFSNDGARLPIAEYHFFPQAKASGNARRRGQLSSLLVEAYENRESIEAKLAEGRRNRKEAGNKYGTSQDSNSNMVLWRRCNMLYHFNHVFPARLYSHITVLLLHLVVIIINTQWASEVV
ncbi:hypothetical protein DL93DRAFT_2168960 [Clavulina sp. PMI_390]|nr:hypothetical protein DL93DRAFT_2168960 [Clavulina sp. PMI_390]